MRYKSAWIGSSLGEGVALVDDVGQVRWIRKGTESVLDIVPSDPVAGVAHLPLRDRMCTVSPEGGVDVWELSTARRVASVVPELDRRIGTVPDVSVSKDQARFFLPGPGGLVIDVADGSVVSRPDTGRVAQLHPNGRWIASFCADRDSTWFNGIGLIDASTGLPLADPDTGDQLGVCTYEDVGDLPRLGYALAWSLDGETLVFSGYDKHEHRFGAPCEHIWRATRRADIPATSTDAYPSTTSRSASRSSSASLMTVRRQRGSPRTGSSVRPVRTQSGSSNGWTTRCWR